MDEFTQAFKAEHGVMNVRVAGAFPNELLQKEENVFLPLIEACAKENCRVAVIDVRDLQVDLDTVALFRAGVDAASMSRSGMRLVLVARPEMVDSFFEVVVGNRGARVEVFTKMEDAREWVNANS